MIATNCRLDTKASVNDLSAMLDSFDAAKLYTNRRKFPQRSNDLANLPHCFRKHAEKSDSPYFDKTVESVLCHGKLPDDSTNISNGDIGGLKKSPSIDSNTGVSYYSMRTDSFKTDSSKDVWCVAIDQIWAEFLGVPSSRSRPVPFVESFPIVVWYMKPPPPSQAPSQINDQSEQWTSNSSLSQTEADKDSVRRSLDGQAARASSLTQSEELVMMDSTDQSDFILPPPTIADLHVLVRIGTKVNIQLNHYQYLFLMRLIETLTAYSLEMEEDSTFINQGPLPTPSMSLSVILSEAEIALVCPAIPELPSVLPSHEDSDDLKDDVFSAEDQVKSLPNGALDGTNKDCGDSALGRSSLLLVISSHRFEC